MKKKLLIWMLCVLLAIFACGCSKEAALNIYNKGTQALGDLPLIFSCPLKGEPVAFIGVFEDCALIFSRPLKGERCFGVNHYTGTYLAAYDDFSGQEAIFGGTSLTPPVESVTITCTLSGEKGSAWLEFRSVDKDPLVLCREGETYTGELALPAGSNYLCVVAENFTGSMELKAE